ncbi:hypothetical protein IF650_05350 [Cellulosimicrobium terreum]|nr:hypothetical protein [Cellulosimicrobium terreum]
MTSPEPRATAVDVWEVDLTDPARRSPGASPAEPRTELVDRLGGRVLGPAERRRAATFASEDAARRYVLSHVAVRDVLARRTGVPAGRVEWAVGTHGKPGPVGGVRWNLSHSGERALVAVSAARDVGVDVQHADPAVDVDRLARRYLPGSVGGDRAATWAAFARLEACVKAIGCRLLDLRTLDVRAPGLVTCTDGALAGRRWWVTDLPALDGYVAACATPGPAPHTTRRRPARNLP